MKWLVATISILAACGGEDNGSISIEELPIESARISCAKLEACCTLEEFMDQTFGGSTIAECEQLYGGLTSIIVPLLNDSVANGRMIYHGDRVADCFAQLEDQSCTEFQSQTSQDLGNCKNPFEPMVANGGVCGEDFDCTSGFCIGEEIDFETSEITYGVCGDAPGAGQQCVDFDCAAGLYCDSGTCATPQPDGAQCSGDDSCESGNCNQDLGQPGTCGEITTCDGK